MAKKSEKSSQVMDEISIDTMRRKLYTEQEGSPAKSDSLADCAEAPRNEFEARDDQMKAFNNRIAGTLSKIQTENLVRLFFSSLSSSCSLDVRGRSRADAEIYQYKRRENILDTPPTHFLTLGI